MRWDHIPRNVPEQDKKNQWETHPLLNRCPLACGRSRSSSVGPEECSFFGVPCNRGSSSSSALHPCVDYQAEVEVGMRISWSTWGCQRDSGTQGLTWRTDRSWLTLSFLPSLFLLLPVLFILFVFCRRSNVLHGFLSALRHYHRLARFIDGLSLNFFFFSSSTN